MPVKRKYIKHGDIVEIPLPHLKGFGYGKIIDPKLISNPIDYPHFIRVYAASYELPISSVIKLKRELLLAPFYIVGGSAAITKFSWNIVDNEPVQVAEEWIPDTKVAWPLFSNPPEGWAYKERYSTHFTFSTWENVQHLDDTTGKNIEVIPFLIQLELLKQEGKDIQKEYEVNGWLEQTIYDIHSKLPVYTQLPENKKGKAVE
jgi:hypothetical protein